MGGFNKQIVRLIKYYLQLSDAGLSHIREKNEKNINKLIIWQ